jgi:hypothetical protein
MECRHCPWTYTILAVVVVDLTGSRNFTEKIGGEAEGDVADAVDGLPPLPPIKSLAIEYEVRRALLSLDGLRYYHNDHRSSYIVPSSPAPPQSSKIRPIYCTRTTSGSSTSVTRSSSCARRC